MEGTQHLPSPLPQYQGFVDGAERGMHVSPGKHFLQCSISICSFLSHLHTGLPQQLLSPQSPWRHHGAQPQSLAFSLTSLMDTDTEDAWEMHWAEGGIMPLLQSKQLRSEY